MIIEITRSTFYAKNRDILYIVTFYSEKVDPRLEGHKPNGTLFSKLKKVIKDV